MRILDNLANHVSLLIRNDFDLRLLQRELYRILGCEDLGEFLECAVFSLHEQEIDESKLKDIPEDKQKVVLPPSSRECNTGDECVVEGCNIDPDC